MDRLAKFFCDPVRVIKFIIVIAVSIAVLIYVYLQTMGGFDSDIETETSYLVNLNDSVSADAYLFRDETIVNNPGNGAVVTLVSEGDRVSSGQLIANVYSDADDASLQDDINRIQRRLDILEDSSVDSEFVISDLTELDEDIAEVMADIYSSANDGDLSSIIGDSSELLVKLNKRDLIVDSDFDYTKEKQELVENKSQLEKRIVSISTPLFATCSGYFYGDVDGYEEVFDISLIDDMSLELLDQLSHSEADEDILSAGGMKIVNDFIWYTVCHLDADDTVGLVEGNSYKLSFPENGDAEISMKLERIIKETNSVNAVAVFRANKFPGGFNYKRFQKAEIVHGGIEGLSVPKKALRVVDGVEGVYILVGDVVRFRRVERIGQKDDYYVVRIIGNAELFEETDEVKSDIKPLELYDNVIVSGKNLFDGKIVG